MEGTGELVEKWEVDDMMNDGDKNQDGMLDYEGTRECRICTTYIAGFHVPTQQFFLLVLFKQLFFFFC